MLLPCPKCYMLLLHCYMTCHLIDICYATCTHATTPVAHWMTMTIMNLLHAMCPSCPGQLIRCALSMKVCSQSMPGQAGINLEPHGTSPTVIYLTEGSSAAVVLHHQSHSHSPSHQGNASFTGHHSSPPPYSHSHHSMSQTLKQPSFQPGAGSRSPPACTLCLRREACNLLKCQADLFWDGSKARCQKNDQGRLVSPLGQVLCFNWNTWRGCSAKGCKDRHKCSGCGNKDHGAQKRPWAQKKPSTHPL